MGGGGRGGWVSDMGGERGERVRGEWYWGGEMGGGGGMGGNGGRWGAVGEGELEREDLPTTGDGRRRPLDLTDLTGRGGDNQDLVVAASVSVVRLPLASFRPPSGACGM